MAVRALSTGATNAATSATIRASGGRSRPEDPPTSINTQVESDIAWAPAVNGASMTP
jgi:hypothetical protein